jgi:hypothetical protein
MRGGLSSDSFVLWFCVFTRVLLSVAVDVAPFFA